LTRASRAAGAVRRRAVRPRALLRTRPVSRTFGLDRGTPVDRVWIEKFLSSEAHRIRGSVLEIGDPGYTRRFGTGVTESHVLHATGDAPDATIVGDLASGKGVPDAAFDCIVLTQTLPFVYDIAAAVATCRRALRPGGSVLATLPGISQISRYDMDRWGDYWRFTSGSLRRLFTDVFGAAGVEVQGFGNLLTTTAYLHGLAAEELSAGQLDCHDPAYELLLAVRARK
jgi:SAM-dependent methyltransferase